LTVILQVRQGYITRTFAYQHNLHTLSNVRCWVHNECTTWYHVTARH